MARLEVVAQIRFVKWTAEGRMRRAAFLGLRSDKSAGRYIGSFRSNVGPEAIQSNYWRLTPRKSDSGSVTRGS